MPYQTDTFNNYVDQHRQRFLDEFRQFVEQPSISANGHGIREMAALVTQRFQALGATVTLYETPGSPIVYAELGPQDAARTLLVYNHYDVQPEDPLEGWNTPPFKMVIEDGVIYGRGTSDDKGELLSRMQAVEVWQQTQGALPVRIKWVVEGEEETSSANLTDWVKANAGMLKADGVLWEGGGYDEVGRPTFGLGGKGIAYFGLRCQGPALDLHSAFAPMVTNPAWRLVWALSTLKDANDAITLDGYMDHVRPLTDEEWARIDAIPMDFEAKRENWGLPAWINGISDHDARRRLFSSPTITICGFHSGYGGEKSKTVLPAEASVKLDFRLVDGLTPDLAHNLLRAHLDRRGFTDITIISYGGEHFAASPPGSLPELAAIAASQDTWDKTPIMFPWYAGSGPIYPLTTLLGNPVVFAGATWHPDSRPHSPNENILVKDYFDSMRFTAAFLARFGAAEA
ncbi:MAG: M20/M25/M40 family metallo-hydrolase [Anaerolineae bacterium]|nr:M20/M25/M40 family metallo-hydrolase [Anaerolineae bacterium]